MEDEDDDDDDAGILDFIITSGSLVAGVYNDNMPFSNPDRTGADDVTLQYAAHTPGTGGAASLSVVCISYI
jgi:hypothetical protein